MNAPAPLRSALFDCVVRHERFTPRRHAFSYNLFYLAIDLEELPQLARRLRLLGIDRRGITSLHQADFLPVADGSPTLRRRVLDWCAARGHDAGPGGRVVLVTIPRVCGYFFNPVSFYFCFDAAGRPVAGIAEVTNTFREVKPFLVPPAATAGGEAGFRVRVPKQFYVSPFSPCAAFFEFNLRVPGDRLAIVIDHFEGEQRTLHSTLAGARRPLTDAQLAWFFLQHPLMPLLVMGRIHWQALKLWLKRVPLHPKAGQARDQRDLLRPHSSIQPHAP